MGLAQVQALKMLWSIPDWRVTAILGGVVALCKSQQEVHSTVDSLSAHKTQEVWEVLATHPSVKLHFTPTYSSWLGRIPRRPGLSAGGTPMSPRGSSHANALTATGHQCRASFRGDLIQSAAPTSEFFEDAGGFGRPDEGLGCLIVIANVFFDRGKLVPGRCERLRAGCAAG
jgi:hypothetical protein